MSDITDVISTAPFLPLSNSRSFLCRELSQLTAVICGLFGRVIIMKIMSFPGRKCTKSIDGAHRHRCLRYRSHTGLILRWFQKQLCRLTPFCCTGRPWGLSPCGLISCHLSLSLHFLHRHSFIVVLRFTFIPCRLMISLMSLTLIALIGCCPRGTHSTVLRVQVYREHKVCSN